MAGNNVYVQGSYVDIHDNEVVNLSVDKGEVHVGDNGKTVVAEGDVPEVLADSEQWQMVIDAGLVDANGQRHKIDNLWRRVAARLWWHLLPKRRYLLAICRKK